MLNAHVNSFKFAQSRLLKLLKGIFFVMIIENLEKSSKKVNHTFWKEWPWYFNFLDVNTCCTHININCKQSIIAVWKKKCLYWHNPLSFKIVNKASSKLELKIKGGLCINPIQNGPFPGCSLTWGVGVKRPPLPEIYHTFPTKMKLGTVISYLKKTQKIDESHDTPLEFCWLSIFHRKSANLAISENTNIDCILIHNF